MEITFTAFNQVHTIVVPASYTIGELKKKLQSICSSYTIINIEEKS